MPAQALPILESLGEVEQPALAGDRAGMAADRGLLQQPGHTVYRVSVDPARLHRLVLPDAPRVAPDRRGARCDRLTQAAATHTRRIKDLVRQLPPAGPACPTDRQGSTASGASAGLPSGSRLPRPH